ncbi:MAG: metallophosphatase domain-containing protein [Planctomycetota bacterium]
MGFTIAQADTPKGCYAEGSGQQNPTEPRRIETVRIVCISDTHGMHDKVDVPSGDLLIHAGDLTSRGSLGDIEGFDRWLGTLPHRHKVVIAGNHDWAFQLAPEDARASITNAIYLEDEETTIEGLRIYGTPWQPWFLNWAFNLQRGAEIREKWKLIPEGVDILVSHGPPRGHGDENLQGDSTGCADLLEEILERIRPRYHVFGHIHEGYGTTEAAGIQFVNASTCTIRYEPINPAVVLEVDTSRSTRRSCWRWTQSSPHKCRPLQATSTTAGGRTAARSSRIRSRPMETSPRAIA